MQKILEVLVCRLGVCPPACAGQRTMQYLCRWKAGLSGYHTPIGRVPIRVQHFKACHLTYQSHQFALSVHVTIALINLARFDSMGLPASNEDRINDQGGGRQCKNQKVHGKKEREGKRGKEGERKKRRGREWEIDLAQLIQKCQACLLLIVLFLSVGF